ncbi:MAG: VWA domain-containing protein, partial [Lachnospiraceae bacterium]|nr:VWA domain-containing protein [Lachnospiraceae bacterium]
SRLPQNIEKLVFTASIDGGGTMGQIGKLSLSLAQNNSPAITMEFAGADFHSEKAIIAAEIYRKGEWRIAAVANGFNGGLSALLASFGGEEVQQTGAALAYPNQMPDQQQYAASGQGAPAGKVSLHKTEEEVVREVMGKINLSKDKVRLEKHVVNLSKCMIGLSQQTGVELASLRAKVCVALDYSGSMSGLYSNGTIQDTIDRLVPLGLTFDDNGSIDVYLFQNDYRKIEDLNLSNYGDYVTSVVRQSGYKMGGTNYAPVLEAIITGGSYRVGGFFGFGGENVYTEGLVDDEDPTFILFITDGENFDTYTTTKIIKKSSEMNVFIQFIGIGNETFSYLMQLDDLPGRTRDNTGFSKMRDLAGASDADLYANVLGQFSQWLRGMQ